MAWPHLSSAVGAQEEALGRIAAAPSSHVIGIDEVGLGACAGPLVVCAAVLPKGWAHERVKDSKKYHDTKTQTAHQRRVAVVNEVLTPAVLYYYLAEADPESIDMLGVDTVLHDLSRAAYSMCRVRYPEALTVMDGTLDFHTHRDFFENTVALPKADALVPAVSAASVLAKAYRDGIMVKLDDEFPAYHFKDNKGYPAPAHLSALREHGVCDHHRRSYKKVREVLPYDLRAPVRSHRHFNPWKSSSVPQSLGMSAPTLTVTVGEALSSKKLVGAGAAE